MSRSSRSFRGHQQITVALLFLAGLINILDRASLSVANLPIRRDLHLSATQMGWMLSAFSLAYGLAQLPLAGLLDRLGTRVMLGGGLAVWSMAQLLTAYVTGMGTFVTMRVFLGVGESPFFPAGIRSIGEWFSPSSRGRATALMNGSQAVALAVGPPLLVWFILHWGWRQMFFILGASGLGVAALWTGLHRTRSSTGYAITEEEVDRGSNPYRKLLSRPMMWGMMLGFAGINYTSWLYTTWLPGYLQQQQHLTLYRAGWIAAIPAVGGGVGMLFSGFVVDQCGRRKLSLSTVHRVNLVVGMSVSAMFTLAVAHAASAHSAVILITAALFFIHYAGTSGWGYVQTVAPMGLVAGMAALQNFASFLIGSIAPVLTGYIVDHTGSFSLALSICSGVTLLGAVSYATLALPSQERHALGA
jgi:MFS family permease